MNETAAYLEEAANQPGLFNHYESVGDRPFAESVGDPLRTGYGLLTDESGSAGRLALSKTDGKWASITRDA